VRAQLLRTCVGCRKRRPAEEMHRVAAALDGTLQVGRSAPGRGAWLCSSACFDLATRRKVFDRALRRPVSNPELEALRATLFDST
jgi:predicted RNA-binding protein YlxR (DUF448 family)